MSLACCAADLKNLSLQSPYSDIVFLIQNLESFSDLLGAKVADERYQPVLSLLFDDEVKALLDALKPEPNDGDVVRLTFRFNFNTPSVKIHERLSEKKFKVHARCRWTLLGSNGQLLHEDHDVRQLTKEVGYEQLLDHVARAFGNDPLLGFRAVSSAALPRIRIRLALEPGAGVDPGRSRQRGPPDETNHAGNRRVKTLRVSEVVPVVWTIRGLR